MESDKLIIITTFAIYLLGMLALGWLAYRRTSNVSDYILGGRRLGPVVTALSAGASDMSGWLLLGLPGYAYLSGFEVIWLAAGLLLGTWINWRLMARRLRIYTELLDNALTIPEYLERRFEDQSHLLRVISAGFILTFFLFYTASGLVAGGKLFETVFGLPYETAVLSGTLTILIYTCFGGFLAVSWTDVVQALLMLLALILIPILAFAELGGPVLTLDRLADVHPALLQISTDNSGQALGLISIASLMGWGLGYMGQPHILARFKAIADIDALDRARLIAVSWTAISLLGACLVGIAGAALLQPALNASDAETVFMLLISQLLHPVPAGICLAAVLAAIMSTADSQLLVSSSALTEDFYRSLFRRTATQRELLAIGRGSVILIAVIACQLAMHPDSNVLGLVSYAWAGFGAAFGPPLLLSLYWQGMNRMGALAGVVSGGVTVLIWHQLNGGIFDLYELIPGSLFSAMACVAGSYLGAPANDRMVMTFRQMRDKA